MMHDMVSGSCGEMNCKVNWMMECREMGAWFGTMVSGYELVGF